ncbi:unnamed protein product [Schistosoma turkestanicum]|nr:unnamed protein product [Schistosoma turkestanicum]
MKLIKKYITLHSKNVTFPNGISNKHHCKTTDIETRSNDQIDETMDWLIHNESNIGFMETIPHVLISYSHDEKDIAKYLVEQLQNKGYKVWVDYQDLLYETDVMDGIAKAVENSFAVCILYSKSYKESFNAKCEAQYAYHEKKPLLFLRVQRGYVPDGWLGFMIGTRLYIDISGKYPFEDKFIELCKRIDMCKQHVIKELNNRGEKTTTVINTKESP